MIADLGEPFHYSEWCEDPSLASRRPAVVLVHGLGGSQLNWLAAAPHLGKHRRVFTVDLPGFGLTPRWKGGSSLSVMGGALSRFIDRISPDAPVDLMGNSMGGAISFLEASNRPERIRSVMGVCPAVPPPAGAKRPDPKFLMTLVVAMMPFGHHVLQKRGEKFGPKVMTRELLRLCCVDAKRVPEAVFQAHLELATSKNLRPWSDRSFAEATRSLFALLVRREAYLRLMRGLRMPAMIVHGLHDKLVHVRASRELCARAPRVELVELPDLGHTPQLEDGEGFARLAEAWMSRHDAASQRSSVPADASHPAPG